MRQSFGKKLRFARAALVVGAALSVSYATADFCNGLFKRVDLSDKAKAFLATKGIEPRVIGLDSDPDFAVFSRKVGDWVQLGEGTPIVAKLRRRGGHEIEATLSLSDARDIVVQFDLSDARGFFSRLRGGKEAALNAGVIDAQTVQLALAGKLFAQFDESQLRSIRFEWKLGKDAPETLGSRLAQMGFRTAEVQKRCFFKKFGVAGIFLIGGGGAGYYAGQTYDYEMRWGEQPFESALIGAGVLGIGSGVTAFLLTCRKPSTVGNGYSMVLTRLAKGAKIPASDVATPAAAAPAVKNPTRNKPDAGRTT